MRIGVLDAIRGSGQDGRQGCFPPVAKPWSTAAHYDILGEAMRITSVRLAAVIGAVLLLQLLGPPVQAVSLPECTTDSTPTGPTFISSAPCGTYGAAVPTRQQSAAGTALDVTVDYMVHTPAGNPKAMVILFMGAQGQAGIEMQNGQLVVASRNFLLRSAQLFADLGYLVVGIDAPDPPPVGPSPTYDLYRISARHAEDIVTVMNTVNAANLPVFLAGTSRGTLSVVAQDLLGIGSMLSSPVTAPSGAALYLGKPGYPTLAPQSVGVPVHVMAHRQDGCFVTPSSGAELLHDLFKSAGVDSRLDRLQGGFDLTGQEVDGVLIDACDNVTYHGYLGMENAAIREIAKRMDQILSQLNRFPGNHRPSAATGSANISPGGTLQFDLSGLATDPDGDSLEFFLPHNTSSRAGGDNLSLVGSMVTYVPPAGSNFTDGFVYGIRDGRGGVAVGIVRVFVTP